MSRRSGLSFEQIPGSIHIPLTEIGEFQARFDTEKTIVVYCAGPDRRASREVAEELAARGFQHVFDYEGGVVDWKRGDEVGGPSSRAVARPGTVDDPGPTGDGRAPEPACARGWRSA